MVCLTTMHALIGDMYMHKQSSSQNKYSSDNSICVNSQEYTSMVWESKTNILHRISSPNMKKSKWFDNTYICIYMYVYTVPALKSIQNILN